MITKSESQMQKEAEDYAKKQWHIGGRNAIVYKGLEDAFLAGYSLANERIKELEAKVDFYRQATDKVRELVSNSKEIGLPCQPLYDAITDHIGEKDKEIKKLNMIILDCRNAIFGHKEEIKKLEEVLEKIIELLEKYPPNKETALVLLQTTSAIVRNALFIESKNKK